MSAPAALLCCGLVASPSGLGAPAALPNPCVAIPSAMVARALGMKTPPVSSLAVVNDTQTCSYAGVKLTVFVGYSAIESPAIPAKVVAVPGLPHGTYDTYAGSTQTAVTFYKGTAATGTYGVIRDYGKIRKVKLETLARVLYAAITGGGGGSSAPGVKIISSS